MIGYIYRITNIKTKKVYVGITIDFPRRKKKHITELNNHTHHSPKLQAAWDYWGKDCFEWTYREVKINTYDDLYTLEREEIKKFDSYNNGYNCNSGGKISDWRQNVQNEDIVAFLCVQSYYGDGYGKTCEEIFGWSKGTASAAKRRIRYPEALITFDKLTSQEKQDIAIKTFNNYHFEEIALKRQLKQGGCKKAYTLTKDDIYFAFAAQSLGFKYTPVAEFLGIKPATIKDWFNGRSRAKEKYEFEHLSEEEKNQLIGRVKTAELSGKPKLTSTS